MGRRRRKTTRDGMHLQLRPSCSQTIERLLIPHVILSKFAFVTFIAICQGAISRIATASHMEQTAGRKHLQFRLRRSRSVGRLVMSPGLVKLGDTQLPKGWHKALLRYRRPNCAWDYDGDRLNLVDSPRFLALPERTPVPP